MTDLDYKAEAARIINDATAGANLLAQKQKSLTAALVGSDALTLALAAIGASIKKDQEHGKGSDPLNRGMLGVMPGLFPSSDVVHEQSEIAREAEERAEVHKARVRQEHEIRVRQEHEIQVPVGIPMLPSGPGAKR
jgi:hypothetical protein